MKLGSKENPYNYSDYESMVANHTWTGGWVIDSNTSAICYITSSGNVEADQDGDVLGSIDNPFSHVAYTEMYAAETWPGGYVLDLDNITRYYHRYYGSSGCGCETGCGCGCGCGNLILRAGNFTFNKGYNGTTKQFSISWGDGTFSGSTYPDVTVLVDNVSISAAWSREYSVRINYSYWPVFYYEIPDMYRH